MLSKTFILTKIFCWGISYVSTTLFIYSIALIFIVFTVVLKV